MIALLRGILLEKHPNQAIVETGGVGYDVTIPVSTFTRLPEPGKEVQLRIHTHVREDALALYGFLTQDEKALFEKLIGVSGIGPTLAVKILSGLAAPDLINFIRRGEVERLVRIPGVGKKTAERMVLELRDKLPAATGEETGTPAEAALSAVDQDVLSALLNLGCARAAGRGRGAQGQGGRRGARSSNRSSGALWNWYASPCLIRGKLVAHARPATDFRRPPGRRFAVRSGPPPAPPGRFHRADQAEGEPRHRHRGRPHARRSHGPRAALRASGAGQDHAGRHHRRGTGGGLHRHLGAGAAEETRPHRHPQQHPRAPGFLHRRNPPPAAGRGRDALRGAGGFPGGHPGGRGAGRAHAFAAHAEVHGHRRHHAAGPGQRAAARPLRAGAAARSLPGG